MYFEFDLRIEKGVFQLHFTDFRQLCFAKKQQKTPFLHRFDYRKWFLCASLLTWFDLQAEGSKSQPHMQFSSSSTVIEWQFKAFSRVRNKTYWEVALIFLIKLRLIICMSQVDFSRNTDSYIIHLFWKKSTNLKCCIFLVIWNTFMVWIIFSTNSSALFDLDLVRNNLKCLRG